MKKNIFLIITIFFGLFIFIKPSIVFAETKEIYVSNSGIDSNNGTSDEPVQTIKKAIELLNTDDGIIYIKDSMTINNRAELSKGNNVVIKSAQDAVTLTWGINNDDINDNDWGLRVINNSVLTLENIILNGQGEYPKVALVYVDNSTLNINDGTILENRASIWFGGAVRATNSKINMTGGKIEKNSAEAGGGAFSIVSSELKISGGEISNNESVAGAGIYATENSKIELSGNVKINNNKSSGYGGGIFIIDGNISIKDEVLISENSAYDKAGGIGILNGKMTMTGGTFKDNSVTTLDGGAIWLENTEATITKALIQGNKTQTGVKNSVSHRGGGIFAYQNSIVTLDGDVIIEDNTAVRGGGIYASDTKLYIKNANIIDNTATANGGGIFLYNTNIDSGETVITGGLISRNKNTGVDVDLNPDYISDTEFSGGGMYIGENVKITIYNAIIKNNATIQDMFLNNRENDMGIYAGGIALCPNAKGYIYMTNGAAIYNNSTAGGYDVLLVPKTDKLPGGAASLHISKKALGGGLYNWLDRNNNKVTIEDQLVETNIIGYNSKLSSEYINNAESQAKVIISDNTTNALYGAGGIMCNGILTMGDIDNFIDDVNEPIENPQTGGMNFIIVIALILIGIIGIEINKRLKQKRFYKI